MARKRQGTSDESTQFLRTVGLAEPESASEFEELTPRGTKFRWTVKIQRFCHVLVEQHGITIGDAAKAAGFSDPTYGSYLLKIAQVQNRIKELLEDQMRTYGVTPDTVVGFWANVMRGDAWDYFEWSGNGYRPKAPSKLTDEQRKRIKKIEIIPTPHGQRVKLELHDPMKAARDLAIAMGMMRPDEDATSESADDLARRTWETLNAMEERDGIDGPSPS